MSLFRVPKIEYTESLVMFVIKHIIQQVQDVHYVHLKDVHPIVIQIQVFVINVMKDSITKVENVYHVQQNKIVQHAQQQKINV